MSELFLDTQPSSETYAHIARVAADSGYGDEELDRIFIEEVAPVLFFNFYSVAGEWMYFPGEWLERNILRERGGRYWLERLFLMQPALWLVWTEWAKAKALLSELRRGLSRPSGQGGA